MIYYFIFSIINYLIGSIPFALVIGKLFYKTDVREGGSHNLGATNTGRLLGRKAAIAVALGDAFKGTILFLIERNVHSQAAILCAIATLIGHCWPLYAHFKGGKAVATSFGIMLAFGIYGNREFIFICLIPFALWAILSKAKHLISLSSIIAVSLSPILCALFVQNTALTIELILIALLVLYRHKENIQRLLKGEEKEVNY